MNSLQIKKMKTFQNILFIFILMTFCICKQNSLQAEQNISAYNTIQLNTNDILLDTSKYAYFTDSVPKFAIKNQLDTILKNLTAGDNFLFTDFYPVMATLPIADTDPFILAERLKQLGFKMVDWGRGNWKTKLHEGPLFYYEMYQKNDLFCNVYKLFAYNECMQDSSYNLIAYEQIECYKKDTIHTFPILGYRFVITGDFNGDGKKEKLIEHFVSGITNTETNKFYENLSDYGKLVGLTCMKEPISFVVSDNSLIDTLFIAGGGQLLGLSFLKNEGDLDGDGGDEISYVVNWADWSNMNTCHIMTYKNNKWQKLYSFPIWDWQLPDLPETTNQYGLFGLEGKIISSNDKKLLKQQEQELKKFKGLVKKIGINKIRVTGDGGDAGMETWTIDLKQLQKENQQ